MSDTHQAIYDAVRSRISNVNIAEVIAEAFRLENVGHHFYNAAYSIEVATTAPHAVMRPRISIDGNKWCALYGDNLQDGVAGFGDSPSEAMADFDKNWWAKLPPRS